MSQIVSDGKVWYCQTRSLPLSTHVCTVCLKFCFCLKLLFLVYLKRAGLNTMFGKNVIYWYNSAASHFNWNVQSCESSFQWLNRRYQLCTREPMQRTQKSSMHCQHLCIQRHPSSASSSFLTPSQSPTSWSTIKAIFYTQISSVCLCTSIIIIVTKHHQRWE